MVDVLELHTQQVEYWNGIGGDRWVSNQTRRDRMLTEFAEAALARAAPQLGESVVDIGCGCGETTVELATRVGPTGRVLGVDVSAPIVAVAQQRLKPFPTVEMVLADASAYPFEPGSADLLFSRFGVMFFGDPAAAFANLRKALKPSGRLVFACWRNPKENPWMTGSLETVFRFVPRPPPPNPDEPGPFSFADPERVTRILTAAGFEPPTFEKVDPLVEVSGGSGVQGAIDTAMEFGPTARALNDQPEEVRDTVASALRDFFGPLAVDGVIKLPAAIWIVRTSPAATRN